MRNDNRGLWIVLGVLGLFVLLVPMLGGGMMGSGMMGGYGPYSGGGWQWGLGMGLGWLGMLAFLGAAIAGIILLVRAFGDHNPTGPAITHSGVSDAAFDVLRHRYASGEISHEEFDRMSEKLKR